MKRLNSLFHKWIQADIEKEFKKIDETGINKQSRFDSETLDKITTIVLVLSCILIGILFFIFIHHPQWKHIANIWL